MIGTAAVKVVSLLMGRGMTLAAKSLPGRIDANKIVQDVCGVPALWLRPEALRYRK